MGSPWENQVDDGAFWSGKSSMHKIPGDDYWWIGIIMSQNLHSCPMFTKNEQEIRFLGYAVDIICTSSAALQQQRLARTKRNVIVSVKSKQKRRSRPTRCTKTLGISEDFEVLLSWTAYCLLAFVQTRRKRKLLWACTEIPHNNATICKCASTVSKVYGKHNLGMA